MAILGLRDSVSFDADRFKNYRRGILYASPNGAAPLTAFLSLTKPEETNDPNFFWYEKFTPLLRSALTASFASGDNTIRVADKNFRIGHQIEDEITGEQMEVTNVDNTGLILTVSRGNWGAAAASSGAADPIRVIGNINAEGGRAPQTMSIDPTPLTNNTQIFRSPMELTGTVMKTTLKYDRSGPYTEKLREALEFHMTQMEWAHIVSKAATYQDATTGKTKRTTNGIVQYIPAAYKVSPAAANGIVTGDELALWMELVFRVCLNSAQEKLVLIGSGALNAINRLSEKVGRMETVAGDESFGMSLIRWYTPFGTLYLRTHPLFTQHPTWRYNALVLDVQGLVYRHVTGRDTQKLMNRQPNDADERMDEFLTESGLEVHHFGKGTTPPTTTNPGDAQEGAHLLIQNLQGASAS